MKAILFFLLVLVASVGRAEINGLVDLRAVSASTSESWLKKGLGKQRFDNQDEGLQLGQAVIEVKGALTDTLNGKVVLNGYHDRASFADVTEIYLLWKPLPDSEYKSKLKFGAFFPTLSLENNGIGWTNPRMLSTSAINTWVGEELRTIGGEFSFGRSIQLDNSSHDFEMISSVFLANDPAGGLIAWRGWSVGDRVTGLTEKIPYAELPNVIGEKGMFVNQQDSEQPFHEIDHHYGYYFGANYGYNGWMSVRALHYDGRGNPTALKEGQYAWARTFDHLAIKMDFSHDITLLSQVMQGNTKMGGGGVDADFNAWYLLLSQAYGKHLFSVRYDNFNMRDKDQVKVDDNSENGHSLAATWLLSVNNKTQIGIEFLKIISKRAERASLVGFDHSVTGELPITESTTQLFCRVKF